MVTSQRCCVWSSLGEVSLATAVLAAPQTPPTYPCTSPYSWESCSSASCVAFYCIATFSQLTLKAYAGSCVYTAQNIQTTLNSYSGVVAKCMAIPGLYVIDTVPSTTLTHDFDPNISTTSLQQSIPTTAISTGTFPDSSTSTLQSLPTTEISTGTSKVPVSYQPKSSDFAASSQSAKTKKKSKSRSWLGPNSYFQINPPSARFGHGLQAANGKLFVFGGNGASGG